MANLSQVVGRTLGLTSLTIGAAAGLVSMGALAAMRRSLSRTEGIVHLPGLHNRVEVVRDRWGVPHIYAAANADLFAALGYVHAQDRLWQMELNRATGHGQLSEMFGEVTLDSDRFARVLGFGRLARRAVDRLDDDTRAVVEAYVRGINLFIDMHSSRLPLEFAILRHQPRPWEAMDVLVWSKMIGYGLSVNWTIELLNARLLAAVGEQRARDLLLHYPAGFPLTVPHNVFVQHGIGEEVLGSQVGVSFASNGHSHTYGEGSNAWVVSGRRTTSGKPLLASDPHLTVSLPSIWYEAHLEGGDYAVTGVTFPGMPGVVIGHNARIAWGITNAMTDVQDLYIERFHPDDPLRYEWCGHWEQADVLREEIYVKGQAEPAIEEVRLTRHGPVLTPVIAPTDRTQADASAVEEAPEDEAAEPVPPPVHHPSVPREALALRWTGFDTDSVVLAALALNRAQNWQQFRAALAEWDTPAQNFVYADVDGHYGYALAGALPVRAQGDGKFPVPGWDGAYEWTGIIPADELPAAYDPSDGLAVTANNRIVDERHTHAATIQGEWMNGYRAMRIREMLEETPRHDVQSFARIQRDLRSLPGLELARLVADLPLSDALEVRARDMLVEWDGDLRPDSVGGTLYAVLRYHLERQAYAAMGDMLHMEAGVGLFGIIPAREALNRRALPGILARIAQAKNMQQSVFPPAGSKRTWTELLQESMRLAVAELRERLGSDPQHWKYSRLHTLMLRHVLGRSPLLAPVFNRGPWPIGGDIDTVCPGYIPRDTGADGVQVVSLYRQICDTNDWDASLSILLGGQSGHPASRHYTDMVPLWLRGEYHPMLWTRARVDEHATATLILEPEHT